MSSRRSKRQTFDAEAQGSKPSANKKGPKDRKAEWHNDFPLVMPVSESQLPKEQGSQKKQTHEPAPEKEKFFGPLPKLTTIVEGNEDEMMEVPEDIYRLLGDLASSRPTNCDAGGLLGVVPGDGGDWLNSHDEQTLDDDSIFFDPGRISKGSGLVGRFKSFGAPWKANKNRQAVVKSLTELEHDRHMAVLRQAGLMM